MKIFPLKYRFLQRDRAFFVDDAGGYFESNGAFLERYASDSLDQEDVDFLLSNGHGCSSEGDLSFSSFAYRWARRFHVPADLDYVILVPTLRCNLACGYCQVSRVNEHTSGHDWDASILEAAIGWLDTLSARFIKIEFQGGEPLLRLDILNRVRAFARSRFEKAEFVVCTNLQDVPEEAWQFLCAEDTSISTSLDSTRTLHQKQRTKSSTATDQFFSNLERAIELSPRNVSALPTLDLRALPEPMALIKTYAQFGLRSIYLRPINHQGFARKRYATLDSEPEWNHYLRRLINDLIIFNDTADFPMEEYYFSHCLRRVLRAGHDGHVDLRNPNIVGHSYVVVDYDGSFYPTDEARMMARLGQIDLRMGDLQTGMDRAKIDSLNAEVINSFHPDCVHCPYQSYCGVDLIDDLSRYGRIDIPKHGTDFCQRHIGIFDLVFELLYSGDAKTLKSLALWAGLERIDPALMKVHP